MADIENTKPLKAIFWGWRHSSVIAVDIQLLDPPPLDIVHCPTVAIGIREVS